jgi:hypothetical protein
LYLAWKWDLTYRDIAQKDRLRLSCYFGNLVDCTNGIDSKDYLVWQVTNIGKEPVMLTHIGGGKKENKFFITPHQPLPRMLQPGEYVLEYTVDLSTLQLDLELLSATDSLGKSRIHIISAIPQGTPIGYDDGLK